MKNILFISPTGTLDNGAEISIINLMEYLVTEKKYNVFNVFPDYQHSSQKLYVEKMEKLKITPFPLRTTEWWWMDSPIESGLEDFTRLTFHRDNLFKIRQIIKDNKIDLVVTNTVNIFYGAVAATSEGIAHYWFIHELPYGEFEYYDEKLPFIMENSDEVFAVTGSLSKILNSKISKFSSKKIHSFIPFSKIGRISDAYTNNEIRFISIGMINENKNQLEILKAYSKSGLSNQLIFIGGWNEEYKKKCDEFIKQNNLSSVKFLGHSENPWKLITSNDISIFSSKSESFGLVYVESIFNGVPTIASNNLGFQTVNEIFNLGHLYQLGEVEALAAAMNHTLSNFFQIKSELINQKSKIGQNFTIETCYSEILLKIDNFKTPSKKSLTSISKLLGEFSENQNTVTEMREIVTIFFCTDEEGFNLEKSFSVHLKNKDQFDFEVPKNATHLRIDLGELPSVFQKVRLKSKMYQTELIPRDTNGFYYDDGFVFTREDPQVLFDINYFESKFTLSYEKINILESTGANFLENITFNFTNLERKYDLLSQNYSKLVSINDELEKEYKVLHNNYHSVIGSRRWIYPTKLINFFRRRK